MLEVLGRPTSINVRKVLWLCDELGLDCRNEPWGSGELALDSPEFLALNPNAMVPVMRDGDLVLWESNTISRYLAAKHGRTDLLPADPAARAHVEQWMDWQAGELNNAWRYAYMALGRKSPKHTDPVAIQLGIAAWNRHMALLDAQLAETGAYAAGDAFTLADIGLGLSANRWLMTPMARPELPHVNAYVERLRARPASLKHGFNGSP